MRAISFMFCATFCALNNRLRGLLLNLLPNGVAGNRVSNVRNGFYNFMMEKQMCFLSSRFSASSKRLDNIVASQTCLKIDSD